MNTKFLLIAILLLLPTVILAQEVEMADHLRENGKIFVVVSVMAIIMGGLFTFLIYLDRKIAKMEKES